MARDANALKNGNDIYTFVTALLGGYQIDQSVFLQILATAQAVREGERDWMVLRKTDPSQSSLPTDTYATSHSLPVDFDHFQSEIPLILVNPNNSNDWQLYSEVGVGRKYPSQTNPNTFIVDYNALLYYLNGNVPYRYTHYLNYVYKPDDITLASAWGPFPLKFNALLAYDVAVAFRGGIDWDEQNERMIAQNNKEIDRIHNMMIDWDDKLQEMAIEGENRYFGGFAPWYSGRVNING